MKIILTICIATLFPLLSITPTYGMYDKQKKNNLDLVIASQHGDIDRVQELLLPRITNYIAFIDATQTKDFDAIMSLLKPPAEVNATIWDNKKDVFSLLQACQNGHSKVVKLLLQHKACPTQSTTVHELNPLLIAAQEGHRSIVTLLLENKALPNQQAEDGLTPLMQAAKKGHTDIITDLINARADVNKACIDGTTALMIAADNDFIEPIKQLLLLGADKDLQDSDGKYAIDYADSDATKNLFR